MLPRRTPLPLMPLATACLIALAMPAQAQEGGGWRLARWAWNFMFNQPSSDTAYIAQPRRRWTLSTMSGLTASGFGMSQAGSGEGVEAQLLTEPHFAQSISLGYRGFSISLPILKLNHSNDREFSLASFGNRLGVEASLRRNTSMSGELTLHPSRLWSEIPQGATNELAFDLDVYYAFNHTRFSFPAAYNHTYIQRRSAGSPFLSMSLRLGKMQINPNGEVPSMSSIRLHTNLLCLGGGYGHSFVLRQGWVLHGSLLTSIAILPIKRLYIDGERVRIGFRFPDFVNTLNLSAVRNTDRWFGGFSIRVHSTIYGNAKNTRFIGIRGQAQLTLGLRF